MRYLILGAFAFCAVTAVVLLGGRTLWKKLTRQR